jgi:hypothetical protein
VSRTADLAIFASVATSAGTEPINQHVVPRHMLARFANNDGRLTVVRRVPGRKVLRRQAPEKVGTRRRFYSYQDEHGAWRHELETGPLASLDGVGSAGLDNIIRFGVEADAEGHMRLWSAELGERAELQLFIASLMVRTAGFRESWDASARETLIADMCARLEEQHESGAIDDETHALLARTLATPGRVEHKPPPLRHHARLVPLIEKLARRLHLDTLVGVRRFAEPLLLTGEEPVVVFPSADLARGCAAGAFFAGGEEPIETWREPDELWPQIEARLGCVAGIAVAADPQTAVLMFNADTDDGGKLAWMTSQVQPEGLAGLMNILVAVGSAWVAGRDDCDLLKLLAESADRMPSQSGSCSP